MSAVSTASLSGRHPGHHQEPGRRFVSDAIDLVLLRENEVLSWMSAAANLEAWHELARRTPHFSALQEWPFVQAWYASYADDYEPLLCLGQRCGKLVGLMALAIHREDGSIQHAGGQMAEYHGWLCEKGFENAFPLASVLALRSVVSSASWAWRWLPPAASWAWLDDPRMRAAGIHSHVLARENYIIELTDEANLKAIRRRKSLRNNINRLSREACLEMLEITNVPQAERVYEAVAPMYDVRMGAMYGRAPVHADQRRKQFFLLRQQRNALSSMCLMRDGRPIAFNFGAKDGRRVLLGFFGFDPLFGNSSPGIIFILRLGEYLRDQGYQILDLTPGRQPFKEQLSKRTETLVMPTLFFSSGARWRASARDLLGRGSRLVLQPVGIRTPGQRAQLLTKLGERRAQLLRDGADSGLNKLRSWVFGRKHFCYYVADVRNLAPTLAQNVSWNEQRPQDLLELRSDLMSNHQRQAFLARALSRLDRGVRLFTMLRDGLLVHYAWLEFVKGPKQLSEFDVTLDLPEGSAFLFDSFTDPLYRRQGLQTGSLSVRLDYCRRHGVRYAFTGANEANLASRRAIERVGFKRYKEIRRRQVFGISRDAAF